MIHITYSLRAYAMRTGYANLAIHSHIFSGRIMKLSIIEQKKISAIPEREEGLFFK